MQKRKVNNRMNEQKKNMRVNLEQRMHVIPLLSLRQNLVNKTLCVITEDSRQSLGIIMDATCLLAIGPWRALTDTVTVGQRPALIITPHTDQRAVTLRSSAGGELVIHDHLSGVKTCVSFPFYPRSSSIHF